VLTGKKIILGISGGIAAYKCPQLVRLLLKEGAEVRVIMTPGASDFVTPQTLGVVSRHEVLTDFFDANHNWNNHVKLAEWADLLLVAPLTANTLAKMASGLCDNLLLAVYMSMRNKTIVAPAMDLEMYRHRTVTENLSKLGLAGNLVVPPGTGELASGLSGEGRMAEPEEIVGFLNEYLSASLPLKGRRALVNAGPTYEAIDPVRFIGNMSSGKMGIAIAEELALLGARVTLVLGPSSLSPAQPVSVVRVTSSDEMYSATLKHSESKDIIVCAAAVADYKPVEERRSKMKKTDEKLSLDLTRTKDILGALGANKRAGVLVGFALETENLIPNATEKLKKKNLDLIVANPANEAGSGIGADNNRISLIDRNNKTVNFELLSKREAAREICAAIIRLLNP
jgi:phosphopantothenoylcysteine decarboxylase / phosphopantothenate---cysteine ligase